MKKIVIGIGLGTLAGVIDVIPILFRELPFQANLSAFSMWIVIGFLTAVTALHMHTILKGILISLLVLLPNTFVIGWDNPASLIPHLIITLLLGGLLGYFFWKFAEEKSEQADPGDGQ